MSSEPVQSSARPAIDTRILLTGFTFLAAAGTLLGAWGFQYIGDYIPCQLCYQQRIPYYIGVPVTALAVFAMMTGRIATGRILLLAAAGIFVWGAYLGGFHAGVEWDWWEGPASCAGGGGERAAGISILDQLSQGKTIVSCTDAAWRFPNTDWGLSFAGWNAVISSAIVGASLIAALGRPRRLSRASTADA